MIWKSRVPASGTPRFLKNMTNVFRRYVSAVTLLALVLAFRLAAFAQTSVIVDVRVLELSRTDLEAMGGTVAKPAFAKMLTKELAHSLSSGSRARTVQQVELQGKSGSSTQLRLDSRISVTSSVSGDVQTHFDVGIGLDATPKVFQGRDISLATASQVRVRRGPDVDGVALVLFETLPSRFDTRIHEGESILLGGFITPVERMALPDMMTLPDNPILNYLFPKARATQDRTEIAILLTPRIVGQLIDAAVDSPPPVSKPAVVNPPVTSITPPVVGPALVANAPAAPMTPVVSNRPPNVSPPPVSTPAVDRSAAVPSPPPVVNKTPSTSDLPVTEGLGGKYTVQVGAFDELSKAEALRAQLSKKFDMVFVEKVSTSKTPYRVRVGRFPDMQSARKIEKQLVTEGFDTYVTTLN